MNDLREHPATYFLAACWVAVYAAMTLHQGQFQGGGGLNFGGISVESAHDFGDLTAREVASGQIWRTITATFVHFSLLHLVLNLTCLISFGRVLESWYGGAQFLAVYVVIGALGNGLAVIGRIAMNDGVMTPCAGGSSVMFGLIALIAVVGWRSKTRFGDYVRRQMLGKLLVFGVLVGVLGRGLLDNYGHGGGAIAGAAVGFSHRLLLRWYERPARRLLGIAALLVLVLCVAAQALANRREQSAATLNRSALQFYQDVRGTIAIYDGLANYAELNPTKLDGETLSLPRKQLGEALERINALVANNPSGIQPDEFQTWRALGSAAALRFPTPQEQAQFQKLSGPILREAEARVAPLIRRPQGPSRRPARP